MLYPKEIFRKENVRDRLFEKGLRLWVACIYPFKSDVTRLTMSCNIFDITISAYYEAVANVIV